MKKCIEFSKGKRNKFAGKKLVIVGDVRARRRVAVNGSLMRLYRVVLPARGDVLEINAASKAAARQEILRRFKKTRLPNGTLIERAY